MPTAVAEPNKSADQSDVSQNQTTEAKNTCRICLRGQCQTDGKLLSPCGCSGSMQWVHRQCLQAWLLTAAQQGRDTSRCELCRQKYHGITCSRPFFLRSVGIVVVALMLMSLQPPFRFIGVCISSLLWCWHGIQRDMMIFAFSIGILSVLRVSADKFLMVNEVPGLRSGVALCFRPRSSLDDVPWNPFTTSVVLLTDYSSLGAKGFIVNKELSHDKISLPQHLQGMSTGYGGPVPGGWVVIHSGNLSIHGAQSVDNGAFWVGGDHAEIAACAAGKVPNGTTSCHALAVRDYAGWYSRQLDREVHRGSWTVHSVTPDLIFSSPMANIYTAVCALPDEAWTKLDNESMV